jgi:hypothetical protein
MELHLSSELEGKLAAAASRRGASVEVLASDALERAVEYDDGFLRKVETGRELWGAVVAQPRATRLLLDLSGVTAMDASGVGLIADLVRRARA